MGEHLPNQSQTRAHKKNVGAIQALDKNKEQMRKDKKKSLQSIDQEVLDVHKFLEQIKISSGNSVSYEEVFPESERIGGKNNPENSAENYRPTKSSLLRTEVKLRKTIAEANFRIKSAEFFSRWEEAFNIDLALDDWFVRQQEETDKEEENEELWVIPVGSPAKL